MTDADLDTAGAAPVVWAHCDSDEAALAVARLAPRLAAIDPAIRVLISLVPDVSLPSARQVDTDAEVVHLAASSAAAIRDFITTHAPAICLWTASLRNRRMLAEIAQAKVPTILAGARATQLDIDRWHWIPGRNRPSDLAGVVAALAVDEPAAQALRRAGLPDTLVEVAGPLLSGAVSLPHDPDDLADMTDALGSRPVWLAAGIHGAEEAAVAQAHRLAARYAHRLVLILAPADIDTAAGLAGRLRDDGWHVARRSDGDRIEEVTQIYVADVEDEMGLWYRLAPTTFMGGTLAAHAAGRDPFEAAAHGSAILYGPHVGRYLRSYGLLAEAGAARIVRDAGSLGQGVQRLLAPDQAAAQAHAAWDVTSRGAMIGDRIAQIVTTRFEDRGLI